MKSVRRSIAGLVTVALTVTGVSVLSPAGTPAAQAAGVSADVRAAEPGIVTIALDLAPSQDFAGTATITVTDDEGNPATGTVETTVTDSADVVLTTDTLPLVGGTVEVTLLPGYAGDYELTAFYPGNGDITEAEGTLVYTIEKATSTASISVTRVPTPLVAGSATVFINSSVGSPTGNVQVQVKTLAGAVLMSTSAPLDDNDAATVALTRRQPGTYALVATYAGDANVDPTTSSTTFTVARVAAVWSIGWNRKPTPWRTGSLRIRVTGGGVGAATGVITVRLRNSNGTVLRTTRIRLNEAGLATVWLPRLRVGRYAVVASYPGDSKVRAGTTVVRFASVRR